MYSYFPCQKRNIFCISWHILLFCVDVMFEKRFLYSGRVDSYIMLKPYYNGGEWKPDSNVPFKDNPPTTLLFFYLCYKVVSVKIHQTRTEMLKSEVGRYVVFQLRGHCGQGNTVFRSIHSGLLENSFFRLTCSWRWEQRRHIEIIWIKLSKKYIITLSPQMNFLCNI